jgi:hypothetical protein
MSQNLQAALFNDTQGLLEALKAAVAADPARGPSLKPLADDAQETVRSALTVGTPEALRMARRVVRGVTKRVAPPGRGRVVDGLGAPPTFEELEATRAANRKRFGLAEYDANVDTSNAPRPNGPSPSGLRRDPNRGVWGGGSEGFGAYEATNPPPAWTPGKFSTDWRAGGVSGMGADPFSSVVSAVKGGVPNLVTGAVQKVVIKSQITPDVAYVPGAPGEPAKIERKPGFFAGLGEQILKLAKFSAEIQTPAGTVTMEPYGKPTENYVPVVAVVGAVGAGVVGWLMWRGAKSLWKDTVSS